MNNACAKWTTIVLTLSCAAAVNSAEVTGLPAGARVLDPDVILYGRPYPNISPDGQWLAYVSKGYVCLCNIANPKPQRLFEVPDTWTHFLARPENADADGDFGVLVRGRSREDYQKLVAQVTNTVHGLRWTGNSDGFVFGFQKYDPESKKSTYEVRFAGVDGTIATLAQIGPDSLTIGPGDGVLTRDRRFIVSQDNGRKAWLWDVAKGAPRACCFTTITASPTSGRWIGIEKDTRQLVIVDESFKIVKRFEEFRPAKSFGFKLEWSPDERFIIWRNQVGFDHFSNWEGFWMNLDSGEKREIAGRYMHEQIAFTGRGGEYFRSGQTGIKTNWYDMTVGAHFTIVSDGDGSARDLWRIAADPKAKLPGALTNLPGNPPLCVGPECEIIAIGFPRPAGEKSGWIWHLVDRDGNKWRFPGEDNGEFISPFDVVGFAEGGKTIVAHDAKRLFPFPVATVKDPANKVE